MEQGHKFRGWRCVGRLCTHGDCAVRRKFCSRNWRGERTFIDVICVRRQRRRCRRWVQVEGRRWDHDVFEWGRRCVRRDVCV